MSIVQVVGSLNFVGLCCDIVGAVFLGQAIFFNSLRNIAAQSGTHWGFNSNLRRALCEQRVDALFGLPLLTLGFTIQALGVIPNFSQTNLGVFGIFTLIIVILLYVCLRRSITNFLYKRIDTTQSSSTTQS